MFSFLPKSLLRVSGSVVVFLTTLFTSPKLSAFRLILFIFSFSFLSSSVSGYAQTLPNNLPITRDPQLTLTTSGEPNSDIEYNLLGC